MNLDLLNNGFNGNEFQFPSNGKLLPNVGERWSDFEGASFNSLQAGNSYQTKSKAEAQKRSQGVSIPFKRETPTKQKVRAILCKNGLPSFNSLQAGNSYQTPPPSGGSRKWNYCFNSLQAGNSYQTPVSDVRRSVVDSVSIPFKRETPTKRGNSHKSSSSMR